ncbi:MAG: ABC transporter substrate-binding protein [Firmicutes bacterium]|nr:ABC transporter substrate-binding protein [Bacillota bacterium]
MKKSIFLLLLSALVMVNACGGNQQAGNPADNNVNIGRVLNVGLGDTPSSLDPIANTFTPDIKARGWVYDYLLRMDDSGNIIGQLAESYEVSDDGLTYTFHLAKEVKFTNGDDLKASDVKFSIDRSANAEVTKSAFANMEICTVADNNTVVIKMNAPDAAFLEKLTNTYCSIVSQAVVEKYGSDFGKTAESAIGTGPYICEKIIFGESIDLVANPNYFRGVAPINKVHVSIFTDSSSAMMALQSGAIDLYMYDVPFSFYGTISQDTNLTMIQFPSYNSYFLVFNCEHGPFADVRMRKAIAYGVDRAKVMQVALEGHGIVTDSLGGPLTVANPGNPDWYKYDLEKAKALIKEAGMEGANIEIISMSHDPFDKIGVSVADDLSKMGFTVSQKTVDWTIWDEHVWYTGDGNFDISHLRWFYATRDMSEAMNRNLLSSAGINISRYSNPAMDDILIKAAAETDIATRKSLYTEALKIYNEDVPAVPLFYAENTRAFTNSLTINENLARYDKLEDYSWK